MFKLNNLKAPVGSNHAPKRKGKGIGSGLGKTAGKGHKGQLARSGGRANIGPGFEGGQMPLMRRSPKVGFSSPLKPLSVTVSLTDLGAAEYKGQTLSVKDLVSKTFASQPRIRVSIVGQKAPKTFPKSVEVHKVSPGARKILEANGVAITIKPHMDGLFGKRPAKRAVAAK